jgi:hypothetical protein
MLPYLATLLTLMFDPISTKFKADKVLPIFTQLLTENEDPICTASNTDIA